VRTENLFPAAPGSTSSPTQSRVGTFLRYWLPVFLWLALIFGLSTDAGSTRHTSRFIRPFLRWLNPELSEASISRIQTVIRKAAHISEYAVLAMLLWRAVRRFGREKPRGWNWRDAGWALSLVALLAVTDEWHQAFVPGRQGQMTDVLFDACGAALGLAALWIVGRHLQKW